MHASRSERLRELFAEAMERTEHARAAFCERQCGEDRELRRELMTLVARASANADTAFSRSPVDGLRAAATNGVRANLDDFVLVEQIGRGGMGVVWRARQKSLGREVAVKLMRPGFDSGGLLQRFKREAAILGQLSHAGIAHVYEVGTVVGEHGEQPFIAMEYVEGCSLTDYAAAHQLDNGARLELVAGICDAIQHAHGKGVIHRDLKPDNILVKDNGRSKILDFGIARVTDSDVLAMTMQTEVGQVVGTVPYMSPEQVLGQPSEIDARSDIYSIGVVLCELLTGRLPIDVHGRSIPEAARVIREDDPLRLSTIDSVYRGDIDTIVQKALEKDKRRRYQTAAELAGDIRRFLKDEPIRARPTTTLYRVRKFVRRHSGLVAGLAATFVVLVAGVVVSVGFAVRADGVAAAARRTAYVASLAAAARAIEEHDVAAAVERLVAAPPELRGFEWFHLSSRLDMSMHALDLPGGVTRDRIRFVDGDHVLSMLVWPVAWPDDHAGPCSLRECRWNAETGQLLPARHPMELQPLPAKKTLWSWASSSGLTAAIGTRGTWPEWRSDHLVVRRTRTARGQSVPTRAFGVGNIFQPIGISDDAKIVAFCSGEKVHWGQLDWRADGVVVRDVRATDGYATQLGHMSEDCRRIVVLRGDTAAYIWTPHPDRVVPLTGQTGAVRGVAWTSAGDAVVTSSADGTIRVWDAETGAERACSSPLGSAVNAVAISEDGQRIASASADEALRIWDRDLSSYSTLHGHRNAFGTAGALAWSRDGSMLASRGWYSDRIRFWSTSTPDGDPTILRGHTSYVYGVAFSGDDRWLVSGAWDKNVIVRDATTLERVATFDSHTDHVQSVTVSPDGELIASSSIDRSREIIVHRRASGEIVARFKHDVGHRRTKLTFDRTGSRLLFGYDAGARRIEVLDCSSRERRREPLSVLREFASRAVSSDGTRFMCYEQALAELRSSDDGRIITRFERVEDRFAFSRDKGPSRLFVTVGRSRAEDADGVFRVFDCVTGRLLVEREAREPLVGAFSPDGSRIAIGHWDGTVSIWDGHQYDELVRLRGHHSYVYRLAFDAEGKRLVSASGDGTLRVWDTKPIGVTLRARQR